MHFSRVRRTALRPRLGIESLESRLALAARPMITEFLASNDNSITDAAGVSRDWIEIYNAGDAAIDLAGWHLTDDAARLTKWTFPSTSLHAAESLIVFGSDVNSALVDAPLDAGGQLHANFRLKAAGEYLALVMPDGATVVSAYGSSTSPFAPQTEDVSFGTGMRTTTTMLLGPTSPAFHFVPQTAGEIPNDWATVDFEPTSPIPWTAGAAGIGYANATEYALVAYWPLDEGAGQVAHDRSGHGLDGILGAGDQPDEGDPAWRETSLPGALGSTRAALSFDGANWVDLSAHVGAVASLSAGTIAAWIRTPARDAPRTILSASNSSVGASEVRFFYDSTGGVSFDLRDNGNDEFDKVNSLPVDPGGAAWRHVAVTVTEDGDVDLYVDGAIAKQGEEDGFFTGVKNLLSLNLGRNVDRSGGQWYFRGEMADVAIWSEPLPSAEVARLAAGASPLTLHTFNDIVPTNVSGDMTGRNASIYVRTAFDVANPTSLDTLALRIRYDDGFIAYLNGVEVARRHAPNHASWDAAATDERSNAASVVAETINLSEHLHLLRTGPQRNVLSFQGLNIAADDVDFLLIPELVGGDVDLLGERYFTSPTPGAPNGEGYFGLALPPVASVERGFFAAPFTVSLGIPSGGYSTSSPASSDITIRYTLDGSAPDEATGLIYTTPFSIGRTTTLRAASFRPGFAPSKVVTQSYLFLADVLHQSGAGFPAGPDYSVNPSIASDNSAAAEMMAALRAMPTLSISMDKLDMFGPNGIFTNSTRRGDDWERGASAEWILPDGATAFQIDAGIRMHGGASRSNSPKRSFRLHFREQWGEEKLDYPLFGLDAASSFDVLVLRGGYNDIWTSTVTSPASDIANVNAQYIRDEWARQSQLAMGRLASHGTWVHLFIDGLYWGLYNAVERTDENFAASYSGGDENGYDVLGHNLSLGGPRLVSGDRAAWDAMSTYLAGDIASNDVYGHVRNYLDVDNFIDYMILNLYGGNRDWPHNNWYASRPRQPDGKFTFYVWDGEMFLGYVDEARRLTTSALYSPGYIYDRLRQNAEFRQRFADRVELAFADGGPLSPEVAAARYQRIAATIEPALAAEAARWGDYRREPPLTVNDWRAVVADKLTNYFPARTAMVLEQFRSIGLYPEVDAPQFDRAGGVAPFGSRVSIAAVGGEGDAAAIYYTTDGSDPRASTAQQRLMWVSNESAKQILVPTIESGGDAWGDLWQGGYEPFDESLWTPATGGVGYDDLVGPIGESGAVGLDLGDAMRDRATSAFARIGFTVDGTLLAMPLRLILRVRYDDGFAAFINGVPVADVNAPEQLTFDAVATKSRDDDEAVYWETIDISAFASALVPGENVLALHGLNRSAGDGAFLLSAELEVVVTHPAIPTAAAIRYEQPVPLFETTAIHARTFDGETWSALSSVTYLVPPPLRITELMYHPADPSASERSAGFTDDDDFEFIELSNIGAAPVSLRGVRFTAGIDFTFGDDVIPGDDLVRPGEHVVVARNAAAFAMRYGNGPRIVGEYGASDDSMGDRFNNAGELVRLESADGYVIEEFTYGDQDDWPIAADGGGYSLVPVRENVAADALASASAWRASFYQSGSPGRPDVLAGDFDRDGRVSLSDLIMLRNRLDFVSGATEAEGDLDGDGAITISDVARWLSDFGRRDPAGAPTSPLDFLAPPPTLVVAAPMRVGSSASAQVVRAPVAARRTPSDRFVERDGDSITTQPALRRITAVRRPAPDTTGNSAVDQAILASDGDLASTTRLAVRRAANRRI